MSQNTILTNPDPDHVFSELKFARFIISLGYAFFALILVGGTGYFVYQSIAELIGASTQPFLGSTHTVTLSSFSFLSLLAIMAFTIISIRMLVIYIHNINAGTWLKREGEPWIKLSFKPQLILAIQLLASLIAKYLANNITAEPEQTDWYWLLGLGVIAPLVIIILFKLVVNKRMDKE